MPGVTGLSAAAPLLFRIFDALPGGGLRSLTLVDAPPLEAPPPNLAHLSSMEIGLDTLSLHFPLDGALVPIEIPSAILPLQVEGGRRPFTWLIDGKPIIVGMASRRTAWRPPAAGFYTVSVIDATGAAARARIEIKAQP
jgi:penicillin-binding protein 1C